MTELSTKSLFTASLGCPRKLYYAVHGNEYDNANSDNDFLRSLAEGGIQVGALARHYYKTKYRSFGYHYIETKDKADALRQTALLLGCFANKPLSSLNSPSIFCFSSVIL